MGKYLEKIKDNQKGMTMVESMVYFSLIVAISVIFTAFTADVVKSSVKSLAIKEVNQSTRMVMTRIIQ